MAEQEEGWPLGLQPLNMRAGLARNHNFSGSISFNTLLSGTPTSSSSHSSSDLDTESTGSFFHESSITLGSLIGVSSIIELSRRSARGRRRRPEQATTPNDKKKCSNKSKTSWCFSLCSRDNSDVDIVNNNTIPLGHFLAVERRAAANEHRNSHSHGSDLLYGPDELAVAQPFRATNSLFVDGNVAPPRESTCSSTDSTGKNGHGSGPVSFPCICG